MRSANLVKPLIPWQHSEKLSVKVTVLWPLTIVLARQLRARQMAASTNTRAPKLAWHQPRPLPRN